MRRYRHWALLIIFSYGAFLALLLSCQFDDHRSTDEELVHCLGAQQASWAVIDVAHDLFAYLVQRSSHQVPLQHAPSRPTPTWAARSPPLALA